MNQVESTGAEIIFIHLLDAGFEIQAQGSAKFYRGTNTTSI